MQDWGFKTWGMIAAGFLVVVLLVSQLRGCRVMSNEEAALLAPEVASRTAPVGSIVPEDGASLGTVQVYVDRTLSMRPFTTPDQSPYFDLLEELDGLLAGDIQFHGFGYPSEERGQVVESIDPVGLEDAAQYTFVNNDYGPLFSDLSASETHLVVSDGVQSDVTEGDRFGGIVRSIGNWMERGGVFALLAYRAPYRGTYYHEAPTTGEVAYDCDNRPFYAFGFFPSVSAKEELLSILEGGGVSPEYALTIGEESASIAARRSQLPENPNARRGPRVLASFADHSDSGPQIGHVYSGRPTGKAKKGTPLHFEVRFDSSETPWARLSDEAMMRVAQSLDPSFRHWRIDTLSIAEERVALTTLESPRILDVTSQSGKTPWRAHLTAPMSYAPKGKTRIASLLTLGLSPAGANSLVPDALSTRRDNRPDACSRTLNIQRTMGAVLREHYVLGRALLVTEW